MARFLAVVALSAQLAASQPNIDGGRGDLPGMKQDMFDDVKRQQRSGQKNRMGKGPPDCPKSDKMSAFTSMALVGTETYVRLDSSEGPCLKLVSIGGANLTVLKNASLTCGPVGEWKKRIAEEMSMVFFQGGLEWAKSENETIEVVTEDPVTGENITTETIVNEAKYEELMECWKRSCGCEQANNPKMKMILIALFLCAAGGLSFDTVKLAWENLRGKKPSKHVECKKGHRIAEVAFAYSHICDICRKSGTAYQCNAACNYDMCKVCYKAAKKKARASWKVWLEKHPEDEDTSKKSKKDGDSDDDDGKKNDDSQSEAGDKKDSKKESEAESGPDNSEAEKDGATPPTTGDEKAEKEAKSEEDKDEKEA